MNEDQIDNLLRKILKLQEDLQKLKEGKHGIFSSDIDHFNDTILPTNQDHWEKRTRMEPIRQMGDRECEDSLQKEVRREYLPVKVLEDR